PCYEMDLLVHAGRRVTDAYPRCLLLFFFNDTAPPEIYTLSLHDALPIFIQEPPSGDLQERVLIRHHDYDQCFQSVQLLQWNSQVKFNVTVYCNLPTTRDSIMTS